MLHWQYCLSTMLLSFCCIHTSCRRVADPLQPQCAELSITCTVICNRCGRSQETILLIVLSMQCQTETQVQADLPVDLPAQHMPRPAFRWYDHVVTASRLSAAISI